MRFFGHEFVTQPLRPIDLNLYELLTYLEEQDTPFYYLEGAKRWYLGIGQACIVDHYSLGELARVAVFADTVRPAVRPDLEESSETIAFITSPFEPGAPSTIVLPLLCGSGDYAHQGKVTLRAVSTDTQPNLEYFEHLVEELESHCAEHAGHRGVSSQPLVTEEDRDDSKRRSQWAESFAQACTLLGENYLQKLVLSQSQRLTMTEDFRVGRALQRLKRAHPHTHGFAFPRIFGASPELIVAKQGTHISSTPLAGTRRAVAKDELMSSEKDSLEHGFVVEHIVERLQRLHADVQLQSPEILDLGDLVHIKSSISATLSSESDSLLGVAATITPTPAIAGTPSSRAIEAITRIEDDPRGLYGGLVGYLQCDGDGELYLAIRSLLIDGKTLTARAGVGLVADSEERAEFDEISAKLLSTYGSLLSGG